MICTDLYRRFNLQYLILRNFVEIFYLNSISVTKVLAILKLELTIKIKGTLKVKLNVGLRT